MVPLIGSVVFRYTPPWSPREKPIKIVYDSNNIWESLIYPDLSVVKNKPLEVEIDQIDDIKRVKLSAHDGHIEIAKIK